MRSLLARLFVTLNNLQYGACLPHCSQPNCSSKCNLFAITNLAINETQHQYSDRKFSVFFLFLETKHFANIFFSRLKNSILICHNWHVASSPSCVSFREYISRRQKGIGIWIWIHASSQASRIYFYKTPCKVDKCERRVFWYKILPDSSISSFKLAKLTAKRVLLKIEFETPISSFEKERTISSLFLQKR